MKKITTPPDKLEAPWWEQHAQNCNADLADFTTVYGLFDLVKVGKLKNEEEEREREILSFVMSLRVDVSNYNADVPLRPVFYDENSKTILRDRLRSRFVEISSILQKSTSPEIVARFSDFVWSYKSGQTVPVQMAVTAVKAYVECCSAIQLTRETAPKLLARLLRAMRLAAGIGNEELQSLAISAWTNALEKELIVSDWSLALQSARVLVNTKCPMAPVLANVLAKHIQEITTVSYCPGDEEELCDLAALLCKNNETSARHKAKAAAIALERAKRMSKVDKQGLLCYEMATAAVDRVKVSNPELLEEALQLLHQANSSFPEGLFKSRTIAEVYVTNSKSYMLNKINKTANVKDALLSLLGLNLIPDKQQVFKIALENAKDEPDFVKFTTSINCSSDGRSIPEYSARSKELKERERAIAQAAHRNARFTRALMSESMIKPGMAEIIQRYGKTAVKQQLRELAQKSAFIAPARKLFVSKGLEAAVDGDMAEALHYLIPQIEAALRYQLTKGGLAAINPGKVAGEIQLAMFEDVFLRISKNKLLEEDVVFALRGLLTEDVGGNLRNEHCHGLMDEADYYSDESYFLLWLLIRLLSKIT